MTRIARLLIGAAGIALVIAAAFGGSSPVAAQGQGDDKAQIALGENIFKGKAAGGLCWTCHGLDAKGMKGLGPDLTDKTWLHGDGGGDFVKATVKTGVMKPKQGSTPMPPGGGSPLNDRQVSAVAAYVVSLSSGK